MTASPYRRRGLKVLVAPEAAVVLEPLFCAKGGKKEEECCSFLLLCSQLLLLVRNDPKSRYRGLLMAAHPHPLLEQSEQSVSRAQCMFSRDLMLAKCC